MTISQVTSNCWQINSFVFEWSKPWIFLYGPDLVPATHLSSKSFSNNAFSQSLSKRSMWGDTYVFQLPALSARNQLPQQKLVWGWKELNSKRSGRMRTFPGTLIVSSFVNRNTWFLVHSFASSAFALWKSLGPWPSWQRDLFLFWLLDPYQRRRRSLMTSSLLELQKKATQVVRVESSKMTRNRPVIESMHTSWGNKSVPLILSDSFRWGSGDWRRLRRFLKAICDLYACTFCVCACACVTLHKLDIRLLSRVTSFTQLEIAHASGSDLTFTKAIIQETFTTLCHWSPCISEQTR